MQKGDSGRCVCVTTGGVAAGGLPEVFRVVAVAIQACKNFTPGGVTSSEAEHEPCSAVLPTHAHQPTPAPSGIPVAFCGCMHRQLGHSHPSHRHRNTSIPASVHTPQLHTGLKDCVIGPSAFPSSVFNCGQAFPTRPVFHQASTDQSQHTDPDSAISLCRDPRHQSSHTLLDLSVGVP